MPVLTFAALFFLFPLPGAIAFQDVPEEKKISADAGRFLEEWDTERTDFLFSPIPGGSLSEAQPATHAAERNPGLLLAGLQASGPAYNPALSWAGEKPAGPYAFSLLDQDLHTLLHQRREEAAEPDWKGITRDTGFFLLYQPVILGVFYLLPESVIDYTRDQKKISAEKYWQHVRDPRFDRDSFWLNFIAHPYWGSTFYTRARERGFDRMGSFGYAVLLSTMFEFLSEAWYEHPSYNDLIVTPVLGSLIGAFITEPLRDYVKSKPALKWYDHAALIATDPLGTANAYMERLLGLESTIRVYYRPAPDTRSAERCRDPEGHCLPATHMGLEYFALW